MIWWIGGISAAFIVGVIIVARATRNEPVQPLPGPKPPPPPPPRPRPTMTTWPEHRRRIIEDLRRPETTILVDTTDYTPSPHRHETPSTREESSFGGFSGGSSGGGGGGGSWGGDSGGGGGGGADFGDVSGGSSSTAPGGND